MSGLQLDPVYKFVTFEEYFNDIKNWQTLKKVSSYQFKAEEQTLALKFENSDGSCHADPVRAE